MLSACGGGGGGAASGPAPAPERLAAYIGTWKGHCDSHEMDSVIITRTPGTTDAIDIAVRTQYFASTDCTGSVLGTRTANGVITAKFVATEAAPVVLSYGAPSTSIVIDKVTASAPQLTMDVSGPGVIHTVKNGQAQWCIDFGGGSSLCTYDTGPQPAQSNVPGGLLLQGSKLYSLTPSASVYETDSQYTRQ